MDGAIYLVGDERFAREVAIVDRQLTTLAVHIRGARLELDAVELGLLLDSTSWRYDVPHCRWMRSGPEGFELRYAEVDFDDSGWDVCPHLQPLYYPSYDGHAWFRHELLLPVTVRGEPITFVLGGMDEEDWGEYRVFLDGQELDRWQGVGPRRDAHQITISPGDQRYELLSFGAKHVVAIETRGLRRPQESPALIHPDHLVFQNWLLDQFVCASSPYEVIDSFEVTAARGEEGSYIEHLEVDLEARTRRDLNATITYTFDEGRYLRKAVVVRNASSSPVRLLDLTLEDWRGDFDAGRRVAGRGQPVFTEEWFTGLEHPAGVNRGEPGRLTVQQLPGVQIDTGGSFSSESTVVGAREPTSTLAHAFRSYLFGLRPRPHERVAVYSGLGWYDYSNPADPLPELTEDLVAENLHDLDLLRAGGASFDIYMLDDWWEPTDLSKFRLRTFPGGAAATAAAIAERGMRPGLWSGTTRAVWTSGEAPGIEESVAGGSGLSPDRSADPGGSEWSWDEEWGALFTRERRLCLASEPYWSMFSQALTQYVADLDVSLIKFDTATLHCTASNHRHMPGKYSVDAMSRRLAELFGDLRTINPELIIVLYWTFRSPWWLRYADTMFDKGLKMEAASPATTPAPVYRQSINLHLDQAARHASLLPPPLQDSLGLWWGNVAITNRFGKEEWRDAFLLELARGGLLIQCWGDITLLDHEDTAFLAHVSTWAKSLGSSFWTTTPVGGDPRHAEPYGYAQRCGECAIVTLFNPSFEQRDVEVDLSPLGLDHNGCSNVELYPFPGLTTASSTSAGATIELNPFEVRCLELVPSSTAVQVAPQVRPAIRPGQVLEVHLTDPESVGDSFRQEGHVELPDVHRHDEIALIASLSQHGVPFYHPDPRSLVSLDARLHGIRVHAEVAPAVRAWTGLGSPWVRWLIPAGPAWSGQGLHLHLRASLPADVEVAFHAVLFEPWWKLYDRRFARGVTPKQPAPSRRS